jgi:hypothetical protein
MLEYLQLKIRQRDWHGVADAAMDLREMGARSSARHGTTEGVTMSHDKPKYPGPYYDGNLATVPDVQWIYLQLGGDRSKIYKPQPPAAIEQEALVAGTPPMPPIADVSQQAQTAVAGYKEWEAANKGHRS